MAEQLKLLVTVVLACLILLQGLPHIMLVGAAVVLMLLSQVRAVLVEAVLVVEPQLELPGHLILVEVGVEVPTLLRLMLVLVARV
jgi:hypothetical protein